MRGFKAKALRRLARQLFPDDDGTPVYATLSDGDGKHAKLFRTPTGDMIPIMVHDPIHRIDKVRALYRRIKKEVVRGRR
jgi:hypothetical protein